MRAVVRNSYSWHSSINPTPFLMDLGAAFTAGCHVTRVTSLAEAWLAFCTHIPRCVLLPTCILLRRELREMG